MEGALPECGSPLGSPEPGVYEIVLPITVFELSDDEFLESEDEEQTTLEENSFCLTSGKLEIVKEGRGVEDVNEGHLNDGTPRGKQRGREATSVTENEKCDEEGTNTCEDLNVVSFQNRLDLSEPDQKKAMGFLAPKMQNRPEKEDVKISKGESKLTDSAAAVSREMGPVANGFVQERLPGLPSEDPGRCVNYKGTGPLETGYNEAGRSPRKSSELSEGPNKLEESPDVGENGPSVSPFIGGNCLPRDFSEDADILTRGHRAKLELNVAENVALLDVTGCQERHDTQENIDDPNKNAEDDKQLPCNKPNNASPEPDVAGTLALPEVPDCQERHDTQENTNDSNENAESDQRLLMNQKEAVPLYNKHNNGTDPEPDGAGKLIPPELTDNMQENTSNSNDNAESDQQLLRNLKGAVSPCNKPNDSTSHTSTEKHAKTTDGWKCFLCDFEGTSSARLKRHIFTVHKNKSNHKVSQRAERCHKLIKGKKVLKKGRSGRQSAREDGRDRLKPAVGKKEKSKYEKFFSKTKAPKPAESFPCKTCTIVFSDPKDLSKHVKEHDRVPPYPCPHCEYASDDHSYFLNHLYWHAGYALYQCNFCTFLSRHYYSLVKHSCLHTGARPYLCVVCQLRFTSASGLNRHKGTHSREGKTSSLHAAREKDGRPPNTYACNDCDIVFYTQAHLQSHKKHHLQGKGCDAPSVNLQKRETQGTVCKQEGKTNSPNNSVGKKSNGFRWMHSCDLCSLTFHTEEHLLYHKAIHLQVQPRENVTCNVQPLGRDTGLPETQPACRPALKLFKCLQCTYMTSSFSNLRVHFVTHTGEKPFKCSECDKTFRNSSHLKRHSLVHVRNRHRCRWCLFIGSTEEDLKVHEETCEDKGPAGKKFCPSDLRGKSSGGQMDQGETNGSPLSPQGSLARSYKCEHCPYRTYEADSLKIHTRIHTGEKPYACEVCQKTFRTSSHLRRHASLHQELKFTCSSCDYSSSTWPSFKQHLASHRKVRLPHGSQRRENLPLPVKIHKCEKCSYATVKKDNLKVHFRIHTDERPYKCPHCGRAFRTSSHLKKHLPTHSKLQCDKCEFSTLDKRALQKHGRTHKKKERSADRAGSSGRGVYKCNKCRLTFSSLRLFQEHQKKHRE